MSTGRTCDGYRSAFRVFEAPGCSTAAKTPTFPSNSTSMLSIYRPSDSGFSYSYPNAFETRWHFTVKPPTTDITYGTGISCELEAQATTLPGTYEPAIHHAVTSVRTLRIVFENFINPSSYRVYTNTPEVVKGLSEYTNALRTLSARLSVNTVSAVRCTLLCCQMFITVELAMNDFTAATQHFIRGMRIMYQSVTRPYYSDESGTQVMPALSTDMPSVDLFILKLLMNPGPNDVTNNFIVVSDARYPPISYHTTGMLAIKNSNRRLAVFIRSTLHLLNQASQLSPTNPDSTLVDHRLAILAGLRQLVRDFAPLAKIEEARKNPWVRLGVGFSMFACLATQAVATLVTRTPGSEAEAVEAVFGRLLAVARDLTAIKREFYSTGRI